MALGTQLQLIVEMVRDEARLSSATSQGIDHLAQIKRLIRRTHVMLADSYEWAHMKLTMGNAVLTIGGDQQFYTFPETLNTDRPFVVHLHLNGIWTRLDPGIAPERYNEIDSYGTGRGDPLLWDWNGASGIEVWPVPSLAGGELHFTGTKKANALTSETDQADIDDILLSLQVAAEILAGNNQEAAAKLKLSAANMRLSQIRASKSTSDRIVISGDESPTPRRPRHPTHVTAS
jgi:hypothetical protein